MGSRKGARRGYSARLPLSDTSLLASSGPPPCNQANAREVQECHECPATITGQRRIKVRLDGPVMAIFTIQGLETLIPEELLAPFTQEAVDVILEDVANSTKDWWAAEAQAELHSSKGDYIRGLQDVEMSPGQAVLALVGVVPNIVEQGQGQTDMRTTLLGPNVPISPEGEFGKHLTIRPDMTTGFYRSIPFRHGLPGSTGQAGKPMPDDVYKAAKKLRGRISDPYKGAAWAEGEAQEAKSKRLGGEFGSQYAGMIRSQKAYKAFKMEGGQPKGRGVQSQYTTFRTISTLQKDGWIRPASPGKHFAERAIEYAERTMIEALEAFSEG